MSKIRLRWLKAEHGRVVGQIEDRDGSAEPWIFDDWIKNGLCEVIEDPKAKAAKAPPKHKAVTEGTTTTKRSYRRSK